MFTFVGWPGGSAYSSGGGAMLSCLVVPGFSCSAMGRISSWGIKPSVLVSATCNGHGSDTAIHVTTKTGLPDLLGALDHSCLFHQAHLGNPTVREWTILKSESTCISISRSLTDTQVADRPDNTIK